jgi:cytochrome c oxidase subunit 3
MLAATILLGSVFLGIKGFEYYHKFEQHLVPGRSFSWPPGDGERSHDGASTAAASATADGTTLDVGNIQFFFSFYFGMTGLHALHMVIGVAILLVLLVAARRCAFSANYYTPVEMTGLYWHFVDIVWVFLFPLLYLIR